MTATHLRMDERMPNGYEGWQRRVKRLINLQCWTAAGISAVDLIKILLDRLGRKSRPRCSTEEKLFSGDAIRAPKSHWLPRKIYGRRLVFAEPLQYQNMINRETAHPENCV